MKTKKPKWIKTGAGTYILQVSSNLAELVKAISEAESNSKQAEK